MQLMVASLAAFPLVASALGLGGIRVESALNEPLNAQIELRSASPAEVRDLAVRLADHEAFSRAGIDRSSVLMLLEFEVQEQGKGRYVVNVRSKEPIREPFLNFLLDAEWEQGRMLREYTVLLDPPEFINEPQRAVVQAPAVEPPAQISRAEPGDVRPRAERPAVASAPAPAAPRAAAPAPAPAAKQPTAPAETRVAAAPSFGPDELFPRIPIDTTPPAPNEVMAGKSDTAWSLARKMRPEGVTVQQVLMALLKSNPEAFEGGNVNRLKAGSVLRIDDPAMLTAISRQEAVQAVAAQNSAWDDFKRKLAAQPAKQTVVASTRQPAPSAATREVRSELTLVSAKGEQNSTGTLASLEEVSNIQDVENLREQLTLAVETAETERSRNRELNDRMKELEEQLDAMQRLISLQDDELATLQQQLAAQHEAAEQAAESAEPPLAAGAEAEAPAVSGDAPAEKAESPVAPVGQQAAAEQVQPPAPATQSAPEATPKPAPKPEPKAEAKPDLPVVPAPWWQSSLVAAGGALGLISSSPLLMAAAITVVLLLILGLMLVVRRRRKLDSQFQESILAGAGSDTQMEAEESSFLSDFAVSGMGDLQTQDAEVDPLTEADVYMAYGRYQQAEELLSQASKKEPGRVDLKLKMLELYHASKNAAGFTQLAGAVRGQLGSDDEQWARVVGMGRELAPQDPLFATAGASAGGNDMSEDEVLDIGLDTGIFQVDDFKGSAKREAATEEGLDLGLDGFAASSPSSEPDKADLGFDLDFGAAAEGQAAVDKDPEPDFGLGLNLDEPAAPAAGKPEGQELGFDLNFDEPTPAAPTQPEPVADAGGDLSFDLDFDTAEAAKEKPSSAAPQAQAGADDGNSLDFDLDFDLSAAVTSQDGGSPEAPEAGSQPSSAKSDSDGDHVLDFDLGELGFGDDAKFEADPGLEPDAAGDDASSPISEELDEVSTKLDLARAYIDMGDPDGARSILDEVVTEGDNHQQQEAQELLKQIA